MSEPVYQSSGIGLIQERVNYSSDERSADLVIFEVAEAEADAPDEDVESSAGPLDNGRLSKGREAVQR